MNAEEDEDFGMQQGDFSISVGGGKNIYFQDEFEFVAPYMVPVSLGFAVHDKVELALEYTPVFFADRSNVNFAPTTAAKNHNYGNIHAFGGDVKYAVYNDYGVMAYFSGGGKYNIMDKNQYNNGTLEELDGTGNSIVLGFGVRYQLGDDQGDLFPWFFDIGIYYSRITYNISSFKSDGVLQPMSNSHYDPLKFNALDVAIRFGYRFRTKK